jgi:mannose-6-phosphate isomerase-like protein (cupin superfamily)
MSNRSKRIWEQPATRVPPPFERTIRVIFDRRDGIEGLTVATSFIAPNGRTGHHVHPDSAELMCVIGGRGEAMVGDERFPLEPEVIFWAGAKVDHQIVNTGDETLKILAIYVPPVAEDFVQQALEGARDAGAGR